MVGCKLNTRRITILLCVHLIKNIHVNSVWLAAHTWVCLSTIVQGFTLLQIGLLSDSLETETCQLDVNTTKAKLKIKSCSLTIAPSSQFLSLKYKMQFKHQSLSQTLPKQKHDKNAESYIHSDCLKGPTFDIFSAVGRQSQSSSVTSQSIDPQALMPGLYTTNSPLS